MNTTYVLLAVIIAVLGTGAVFFFHRTPKPPEAVPTTPLQTMETLNASTFRTRIAEGGRVVIDVRTPQEYSEGHIPHAINIDYYGDDLTQELRELDTHAPYALYCRSGNRSGKTLELMRSLGFTDVIDLAGGVLAWEQSGETLCRDC